MTTTNTIRISSTVDRLVLSGGGVLGLMFCGAAQGIDKFYSFQNISDFAGTSAGSIFAAAFAAGYTPDEVTKIVEETDFMTLVDGFGYFSQSNWWLLRQVGNLMGYMGSFYRLAKMPWTLGLFEGNAFENWIDRILSKKTGIEHPTFHDLPKKLSVVATDLETTTGMIFSTDTTPNMTVSSAVRASMSVPGVFCPIDRCIVDGGVVENYPLYIFGDTDHDMDRVVGLKLISNSSSSSNKNNSLRAQWGPLGYAYAVVDTFMAAIDRMYVADRYWQRTVPLMVPSGTSFLDFSLTKEQKKTLIDEGYRQTTSKIVVTK